MKQNILIHCFFFCIAIQCLSIVSGEFITSPFSQIDLNKVSQCQQALDLIIDNVKDFEKSPPEKSAQFQALLNNHEFNLMLNDLPFYCALEFDTLALSSVALDEEIICLHYQNQANQLMHSLVAHWEEGKMVKIKGLAGFSRMLAFIASACQKQIYNHRLKKELKIEEKLKDKNMTLNLTTNYMQCFRDVELLVPQMMTLTRDLKNHTQTQIMLKDLLTLIIDITHTVADCGILPSDDETIADDVINCIHDAQVVEPKIQDIITEVEQQNITFVEVMQRLYQVYTQNNQAFLKDCGIQAFFDEVKNDACTNDLSAIMNDLMGLVSGKVTNMDQLKALVADVMNNLKNAISDCVNIHDQGNIN